MAGAKRASMREGPLAALFRKTEALEQDGDGSPGPRAPAGCARIHFVDRSAPEDWNEMDYGNDHAKKVRPRITPRPGTSASLCRLARGELLRRTRRLL